MPLSDKAKYEAIAKCHKNGDRNAAERYTTHGIAFSIIDNERQREEKKINDMHQKLVDIVEGAVLRKGKYFMIFLDKPHLGSFIYLRFNG